MAHTNPGLLHAVHYSSSKDYLHIHVHVPVVMVGWIKISYLIVDTHVCNSHPGNVKVRSVKLIDGPTSLTAVMRQS